jgi:hypothetical protein
MRLLTQREAASVLRLSQRTLERFRVSGAGPTYVKAGALILNRAIGSCCVGMSRKYWRMAAKSLPTTCCVTQHGSFKTRRSPLR